MLTARAGIAQQAPTITIDAMRDVRAVAFVGHLLNGNRPHSGMGSRKWGRLYRRMDVGPPALPTDGYRSSMVSRAMSSLASSDMSMAAASFADVASPSPDPPT